MVKKVEITKKSEIFYTNHSFYCLKTMTSNLPPQLKKYSSTQNHKELIKVL